MISYLNGKVVARNQDFAIIDINGVGFQVFMSGVSLSKLPEAGNTALVYTYMHVKEDGMTLFGFISEAEKTLFEQLISVSGIGPKVALSALSFMSVNELTCAITSSDVKAISKVPGIGKKTAQRMILELKGVLASMEEEGQDKGSAAAPSEAYDAAMQALLSMGFTSQEAKVALKGSEGMDSDSQILQYALKRLA